MDHLECPVAIFLSCKVPWYAIWAHGAKIEDLKSLHIEAAMPPCGFAESTTAVELKEGDGSLLFDHTLDKSIGINGQHSMNHEQVNDVTVGFVSFLLQAVPRGPTLGNGCRCRA